MAKPYFGALVLIEGSVEGRFRYGVAVLAATPFSLEESVEDLAGRRSKSPVKMG
jgi:hypothetical protein